LGVTAVEKLDFSEYLNDDTYRELLLVADLWQGERRAALQVATFAPAKHLKLVDPEVKATLAEEDGRLAVTLTSRSLARLVELSLEGADVVFSDNYFDLPAGRPVSVFCLLPAGWTLAQARAALKIRSVYDSYA
jgi:beta-mannosidase